MKRFALVAAFALVLSNCAIFTGADDTRTILVDYDHDEFASLFIDFFPKTVKMRPGQTIQFRQSWTGEPHTVTFGTSVDRWMEFMWPNVEKFRQEGPAAFTEEEFGEIEAKETELSEGLPDFFIFNEETGEERVAQNGAQPCFLDEGLPPEDPDTPCEAEDQVQPEFDGSYSYYNSGFIPYEGPGGNEFDVKLADDIDQGTYYYYCNLHGPLMSGRIDVVSPDEEIPSQEDVNRQALEEIEKSAAPLLEAVQAARNGTYEPPDEFKSAVLEEGEKYFSGNFAGMFVPGVETAGILEFIPGTLEAKAGEPVTWVMLGFHSISFNVPPYFPIIEVDEDDRTVSINPRLFPPAGGAPDPPSPPDEESREPVKIDAGEWDGEGYFSSGLIAADPFIEYTLTFTDPGTYKYACLIHPNMIGTVEVS